MAGYIGSKAVLLSTTAATVTGDATIGAGLTVNNDAATVLTVDRATSDGTLVDFKKSGTTVGSIGNYSGTGNTLLVGSSASHLAISHDAAAYFPAAGQNTVKDNAIDLGRDISRFKDLYLSGGVYLGGTGVANLLDDYETGTWTPTVTFGNGSVGQSYTIRNGYYTKIGQSVHVTCYFAFSNKGTSVGTAYITGLPFTSRGANCYSAGSLHLNAVTFADWPQAWVITNSTSIQLQETTNAGTTTSLNEANFSNFSGVIFTAVYMTDQ